MRTLLILLVASTASAAQVTVTRVPGTFEGGGGEFNLTAPGLGFVGGVPALSSDTFQTFCLERNEPVTPGGVYNYVVNTGAVLGGISGQTSPGFDPLSPITAWMYSEFVAGTLEDYDYTIGSGREESAEALQNAIWFSEGELTEIDDLAEDFYEAALEAAPTSIGRVRVLNLFQDGVHKQDQIFMAPEPEALLLMLMGVVVLSSCAARAR